MLDIKQNRRARKYSSGEIIRRVLWAFAQPLFRFSPRPCFGWRRFLLRCFGAKIGAHFISKLTDSDGENSETDSSLDFARDCEYISADEHQALTAKCAEIGRMLGRMLKKSQSFLIAEC
ncbi:MAG: hypothetical protein DME67_06895 [Verrucomicrobia bacterium]|nr:MAG: hypothetical protein DME67_06895 [Verrucomicrobiota bacterium]